MTNLADAAANRLRLHQTLRDMAVLFAALAIVMLFFGGLQRWQGRAIAGWPVTQGTVTNSGLETVAIRGRAIYYAPAVAIGYDYVVDGQSFSGSAVSRNTAPVLGDTAEAGRLLAAYPVGAIANVTFNPHDPSEAYLEPQLPSGALVGGLMLSGLALVIGLAALLVRP